MALDPIHAFAEGISSAWTRTLFGLGLIALSTFLGAFISGEHDHMIVLFFPLYLLFASLSWGYFMLLSIPLLLVLSVIFIYCVHHGYSRRGILWLRSLPFLLVVAPDWFYLIRFGSSYRSGWTMVSLTIFAVFIWRYGNELFRKDEGT